MFTLAEETPTTAPSAPRVHVEVTRRDIPCNLCGSSERKPFCPENGRSLVQCQNCSLVYVNPRPDPNELYALYGETYFHNDDSGTVGYSNYLKDEPNIRLTFSGRLNWLEKFTRGHGLALDVGCAAGFFLSEADKRGWKVKGLDVSAFAAKYAAEHFGFDVQHGSLTELEYPAASFDLVTMWDVIEHVPDPMAYIKHAVSLLKVGGVFSLATPDVDSIPARLTGKRWVGYKLSEEHVYYFSVKTLVKMFNDAGLDVVDTRHVGKYVTLRLFFDRLSMYSPILGKLGQIVEQAFKLSEKSLYVNPYDIVAVTGRKR